MRTALYRQVPNPEAFRSRAVKWASQFEHAICLDSNGHQSKYSSFDFLVAADASDVVETGFDDAFQKLAQFHAKHQDWIFGYLGYDCKNDIEDLVSQNPDGLNFPDLFFFRPKKLMILRGERLEMIYLDDSDASVDFTEICKIEIPAFEKPALQVGQRISRHDYIGKIHAMQRRIARGDIYEANFCMEFFAWGTLDTVGTYLELNRISKAPFAAFFKSGEKCLLSASPERYLKKQAAEIISQPIKGTSPRSEDPWIDALNARNLQTDEKERAENIMIVDLVRNDLSRTAVPGSVQVEELCGVHTFRQVHQLISTISSQLRPGMDAFKVLRTAFPMGSMTGAPKISAMKIIEELEQTRRGLYSGALGYITPESDFDFNVVIRSILYNQENHYVSFQVGSAITHLSNAQKEYDECMVKAAAMMRVLGR